MSGRWFLVGAVAGAGLLGFVMRDKLAGGLRSVHLSYDDAPSQPNEVRVSKDEVIGKWREIIGKVKAHWGSLTEDEITQSEGKLEELAGKIQQKYGGIKEEILAHLRTF